MAMLRQVKTLRTPFSLLIERIDKILDCSNCRQEQGKDPERRVLEQIF
jgi:hypothetical protein